MRPLPSIPPPALAAGVPSRPDRVTQKRTYRLITPLFGGGVDPGAADPITVVRGAEVRGQLRFWWRATRGGHYSTVTALRAAEGRLWGAASTERDPRPSQVQIAVAVVTGGTEFAAVDRNGQVMRNPGHPRSIWSYGTFPLKDKPGAKLWQGVCFDLALAYPPAVAREVEAALWAWEAFGGLGARTRRGFGALYCEKADGPPDPVRPPAGRDAAAQWLQIQTAHYCGDVPGAQLQWPPDVPHLDSRRRPRLTNPPPQADVLGVLLNLLDRLKAFRQQRPGPPFHPGRSRWPEPDEIRRRTMQRLYAEDPNNPGHFRDHSPVHPVPKFPRAAFGLPIIFHFKDESADENNLDDPNCDPAETTLTAPGRERLASPLILRPLVCADGVRGLGLRLAGTQVPGVLELRGPGGPWTVQRTLQVGEANRILRRNGQGSLLNGRTDVLEAFLDTLV